MVKDNRRKERSRQPRVTRSAAEGHTSASLTKTAEEIAHELGNIFMSISFSSTQLLAGIPENSPLHAAASAIAHDAAEGRSLSGRLRSLFYQAAPAEPVDLNRIVEEARTRLRGLIPASIEFDIVPCEHPVLVEAESEDVERIITNLVINACDAMENDGTLTIRVEEFLGQSGAAPDRPTGTRNFGKLAVEHTGRPIPQEARNDLLRAPAPGQSPSEAGIELAIVDAILIRNNGSIEVESGEGFGMRITVLLPQAATGTAPGQSGSAQDKSA